MKRTRSVAGTGGIRPYSTGMAERLRRPKPEPLPVRVAELDWRSVAVVLAAFVGLVAFTGLVRSAPRTITAVIIGSLLALALDGPVSSVERRLGGRRPLAVATVLLSLTLVLIVIGMLVAPPAIHQADHLKDEAPRVVRQLGDLPVVGPSLRKAHTTEKVQQWIENLPDRLAHNSDRILRTGQAVINGALTAVLTLLVAVALLLDGERLVARAMRLTPAGSRARVQRIGRLAYSVVGHYAAGSLAVAAIAGLAVMSAGLVLHVPLTPLLAVWVALFDLVPQIGGAAGGIPFVALGLTHSAATGVICLVFFVLYLQLENHVLQPLIVGKAVKLSPPATMIAALVGVSAMGVVGALVAVPVVGAVKAVYVELRSESGSTAAEATQPSSRTNE